MGEIPPVAIYYAGVDDKHVCQLLAKIIRDEAESLEVRFAAYDALFAVHGSASSARPLLRIASNTFRIPEDVDWGFVADFDG